MLRLALIIGLAWLALMLPYLVAMYKSERARKR